MKHTYTKFLKRGLALAFVLLCYVKQADAEVFALTVGNNTVYFTITDQTNHYVKYVCPNENNVSWDGFVKPTGILDLPGNVCLPGEYLYCDFHWKWSILWMLGYIRGNHPQHCDSNV